LALDIAAKFNVEIVNADSRQVYRHMDIGTDKPSPEEMASVPHHLFNVINPDEDFGLAQYQELAFRTIRDIHERNKVPLLVGGSGQYVWAVLEGWEIPRIPPDKKLRKTFEDLAAKEGIDHLYRQLQEIDHAAAQKIDKRNVRRVIRALEVSNLSQVSFSHLQRKKEPYYRRTIIGLTAGRKELYRRTDSRVDLMVQRGLVDEAEKLIQMGYDYNLPAMNSIGYKQIGMMLRGEISLEEAIKQIKVDNHRFVRHQYAWFRLKDKRIHWFDILNNIEFEIMTLLSNYLNIY
jgi:tRNA dimethylallyltransferase